MKFERITNELYGARNAGYVFDSTAPRTIDQDVVDRMKSRGEAYIDNQLDAMYDNDGDLYRGEDGEYYGVIFGYVDGHIVPLAWQRMVHA